MTPDGTIPPRFGEGEIVTVFRSRLRPDAEPGYSQLAEEMVSLARQAPGFVDFKAFVAEDGERVSLVTFSSPDTHRRWRDDPRHRAAQLQGRDKLYSWYSVQVGDCLHARQWEAPPAW